MEELTLTFSNLHLLVTIGKIVKLIKMANKKFEFNKSLKDLNVTDLKARIEEDELRLKKLEFAHAISPLENPMSIRALRRDIARLKTALKNKALVV
ncbi:MAG: 50S ribosomal protein L29 [Segetibacter sp.]